MKGRRLTRQNWREHPMGGRRLGLEAEDNFANFAPLVDCRGAPKELRSTASVREEGQRAWKARGHFHLNNHTADRNWTHIKFSQGFKHRPCPGWKRSLKSSRPAVKPSTAKSITKTSPWASYLHVLNTSLNSQCITKTAPGTFSLHRARHHWSRCSLN